MAQSLDADLDESTPSRGEAAGASWSGPFRNAASELLARRLAVLPCGGEDGKVPLIKWRGCKKLPPLAFIEKMAQRHPHVNVGIITGQLSGVTVVDCDDGAAVVAMIRRCGDTPLKTRTPSGGVHLWYRHAGEGCANLRDEGLNVDVRGAGGIIIVPPSVRPTGPYAGCTYEFIEGSWDDLTRLPTAHPGSLPMAEGRLGQPVRLRAVMEGRRNNTLFRFLLRQVRHCESMDDLRDVAEHFNESCNPPLNSAEIEKTVRSVWDYEERGENWAGKEPKVSLTRSKHEVLRAHRHGADASFLLATLRFSHWDRNEFAAAPEAMAKADVISGWGHQRYRNALKALVDTGILTVTHQGGSRIGDARQYAFSPCLAKATRTGGNITRHLFSSLSAGPVQAWSKGRALVRSPRRTLAAARLHEGGGGVQLDLIELLGGPPALRRIDDPGLFGSAAREARIARNLTQAKAAVLAGISRSALSNIETGTFPAGLGTQVRLAAVLGLPLAS